MLHLCAKDRPDQCASVSGPSSLHLSLAIHRRSPRRVPVIANWPMLPVSSVSADGTTGRGQLVAEQQVRSRNESGNLR